MASILHLDSSPKSDRFEFIHPEGLDLGSESREEGFLAAQAKIQQFISKW